MTPDSERLTQQYVAALQDYVDQPGEAPLKRGYEVGRTGLLQGLTVLDLCAMHQEALLATLSTERASADPGLVAKRSADFLMESLSSYALNQLGADDTLAKIRERNYALEQRLADIAVGRQRAEEALRAAERQTQQAEKLRALGQMASGVAHDLNQSLGLIAGYSELASQALVRTPPDLSGLSEMLDIVARAARDGGQTVRRLLTFARPHSDAEKPQPIVVDGLLREVAQLTAPRWRDAAQATGCHISLHVEAEAELQVDGWPAALREALTNLVFNAVDAMPEGGTIRLAATREGDSAVVEVADSGIGMSPEVQARVFEPFFSTKGERGTGLGLAHVFGVIEQHGGEVSVRSAPGSGSTFRLVFPGASLETAGDVAVSGQLEHDATTLRVLVVDDEVLLANMAAMILEGDGHKVTMALSGEEALEQMASASFDVVLSDVGMGAGMNGWELAERVRQRWPDVSVVLVTGWGAQIDPNDAKAKGIAAIIGKPYQITDLRRVVESVRRGEMT